MIRVVFCLRRPEGMSRDDFQRYWLTSHGPLVASVAERLGISRYVQLHATAEEAGARLAAVRGAPEPFDGIAELWFDDPASLAAGGEEARQAAKQLLADEREFIDLERSPIFIVEEHELTPRRRERR